MIKIDIPYMHYVLDVLRDIENSMKNISKDNFEKDTDKRDANIRRLGIMSEAIKNISEDLKNKYKNIEWQKFIRIKELLINHYFGVDTNSIWRFIKEDLPKLKLNIGEILEKEEDGKKK
ncbi:MAG: HepT-like ribonuclease domain-containing protein [Nanoarchaeota archaeon]